MGISLTNDQGSLSPLGIAVVVGASVAAGYLAKQYLFSDSEDMDKLMDENKKLVSENTSIKAQHDVIIAKSEIASAKNELAAFSNERKSSLLKEQEERLNKDRQDYQSDLNALKAMEKRLKVSVTTG